MKKRILGRTGLSVSEIAFGGVEIGMPYGLGAHEMPEEASAIRLLQKAVELGINFFDTARHYGESERLMGLAFEGIRDQVVLATKCVHFKNEEGNIPSYGELKTIVHESLEVSLKNLKTDYVDLFMVHYADMDILQNDDVIRVFSEIRQEGHVKNIGVSVYKVEETAKAIQSGIWDTIQLPFNLMDQSHGDCFQDASEKGVGIIVRSVLMRGMLTERKFKMHEALKEVENYLEAYRTIAETHFRNFPEYATKFALKHPQVSSVLVGIDKEEYLQASIRNLEGDELSTEIFVQSKHMQYPDPSFLNLAEWDRKGWL
ncbi:aldo/keto reductase [Sphingobacterium sp. SGR-19]|uniref:aldo/keto reductase n=1 Tax=Sphingobacterium sp. SGR-19 TaxID=2710886 RepID=UPI0013EC9D69|nr:aldo/keto reductase [Sphingobacterium sp. SGR-19]NGM64971.1 aldo/keto reductase [Sphingobacterium sp. SGR-19]